MFWFVEEKTVKMASGLAVLRSDTRQMGVMATAFHLTGALGSQQELLTEPAGNISCLHVLH